MPWPRPNRSPFPSACPTPCRPRPCACWMPAAPPSIELLVELWPALDRFAAERTGPAWKQVEQYATRRSGHGSRQERCEMEQAGQDPASPGHAQAGLPDHPAPALGRPDPSSRGEASGQKGLSADQRAGTGAAGASSRRRGRRRTRSWR